MNAKLNTRAAQIMEQFNSSAAKLNNGTIVIGGRVEAPTARKLVRLGLIEQAGDFGVIYRATAAGREWLAANTETETTAAPAEQRFELLTEVQSADGTQWQVIDTEHIMARDMERALSLIGDPNGLSPDAAWRVSVYVAGNFAETVRMVYSLHLLGDAQA